MVLAEASAPASDASFAEPDFAADPWNSSDVTDGDATTQDRSTEKVKVDFATLPRPLSLFGPLKWEGRPERIAALTQSIAAARDVVGRPLRQEEVDALAYKYARSIRVYSYFLPTSIVGGALLAYKGREKFKFPGVKDISVAKNFNPDKLLFLRGTQARLGWHLVRTSIYMSGVGIAAALFFGSMAVSLDMAATIQDPRLKDYKSAITKGVRDRRGTIPQKVPTQRTPIGSQTGQLDNQAVKADAWSRAAASRIRPGSANQDDDMSPSGGAMMQDLAQSADDTGLLTDSQMQANEKRQEYAAKAADRIAQQTEVRQQVQTASQPTNQVKTDGAQTTTPAGSVWERVRREAASRQGQGGSSSASGQPRQTNNSSRSLQDDSHAFQRSDNSAQINQNDAQKDFDSRLDRERQGKNFEDEGRNRQWR